MKFAPIVLITLGTLTLTGCSDKQGEGPMKPGIYTVDGGVDGAGDRMVFTDDGRYSQMADNKPKPEDQGNWERRDGKFCMKSDKGTEGCFEEKAVGNAGDFSLSLNGQTATFRAASAAH